MISTPLPLYAPQLKASVLALASLLCATLIGCSESPPPKWNVLLVTLDTMRADHVEPYGAKRAKTPTLSTLADNGFVFEQAFSVAPITAPSHASILTGKYPISHGFRDNGLFKLDDAQLTLPEILKSHGYTTAAAVGAYPVMAKFGFDQGFDFFDDELTGHIENHRGERVKPKERLFFDERRAGQVNEAVLPWLNEHAGKSVPFFLWVHYFDAHQPFEPPPPFDQLYADDLYSGEISYADEALGRLLRHLDALGELDNTLVVVTADHGEGLGEHGEITHAVLAYNSTLRVPFIIRPPKPLQLGSGRLRERVGTVDIVPTILKILNIDIPEGVQGRSLLPLLHGEAGEWRQYYAENLSPHLSHGWGKLRVLFDGDYKYIHGPRPELYNLARDPDERQDLLAEEAAESDRMHHELELFLEEFASGTSVTSPIDDETVRMLQSLGYLQGGSAGQTAVSEALESGGVPPHLHVSMINNMSAAKHLLFMKRYGDALEYTRKLIEASPDSPSYREMHLVALMGIGRLNEAWAFVHDSTARPLMPAETIMSALASARFAQGHQLEAIKSLSDFAISQCSARAHWRLAGLFESVGDVDKQTTALKAALECDQYFARARVDLAVVMAEKGDEFSAEKEFSRVLTDAPFDAHARYNFGVFLLNQGRIEHARTQLYRAIELAPDYGKAYLALLAAALDIGDVEEASKLFEAIKRNNPHSPEAVAARALMQGDASAPH